MPMKRDIEVLEYETPTHKPRRVMANSSRNWAITGYLVSMVSLLLPLDIGSGAFVLNPLRVVGCAVAVICTLAYALIRLWTDPGSTAMRRVVLSGCLLLSIGAFLVAHFSIWGGIRLPRLGFRHAYWRYMAVAVAAVLAACAYCAAEALGAKFRQRKANQSATMPSSAPDAPGAAGN